MKLRAGIVTAIIASFVSLAAYAGEPAPADVVADAVHTFDTLCLAPGADRNTTTKLVPDDGVHGKQIPTPQTEAEQGGPGGIAWYVRAEHGQLLKVTYSPNNICSVDVPVVDTAKLGKAVADLLAAEGKAKDIRYAVKADKIEKTGTLTLHRIFYMIDQKKLGTVGYLAVRLTDGGQLDEHRGQLSYVLTTDAYSDKKEK
jgi:hypothetical protein